MSRIGKKAVSIPSGVSVMLEGQTVTVKGPKGQLAWTVSDEIEVKQEGQDLFLTPRSDTQRARGMWGLSRTLIANMVEGVTKGFKKELELVGVGYKAEPRPYGLQLALGFSHPVKYEAPKGIKLSAPQPTSIIIEGANKEVVGQVAAELRSIRPPEPYKGKGVKYVGEQVRRKAGKAGGK
jgi:large subunit ribosomal protein L6